MPSGPVTATDAYADDGCRLWTEQSGAGDPLVFCHGGPGLWDYLGDVAGLLAGLARVVRWDQRGCGRSQRRGPYTVARSVADLDVVRRHLAVPRVALLGHSWGAMLALRYALAHPDRVTHLIYVAGTGIDPDETWRPAFHRALRDREPDTGAPTDRERAIRQWTGEFVDPTTARRHAERLATPWLGINDECARDITAELHDDLLAADLAARCRDLAVLVLIVDGDRDRRPRRAVDSLERALPDVRRVVLAGAGHLPWVEDPAGFRRAVADFLNDPADPGIRRARPEVTGS